MATTARFRSPRLAGLGALALCAAPTAAQQTDLSIGASLEDLVAMPGARVTADYRVVNSGSVSVSTTVSFYLSTDAVYDGGDVFLESEGIQIDAHDSESDSEQFTIPSSAPLGRVFVLVFVDPDNTVAETDETNNVAAPALLLGSSTAATTQVRQPCQGSVIADGLRPWASSPELGDDFVVEIDDPRDVAGMPAGTTTLWCVATAPAPGDPCGVLRPGFGVSGQGEVLIDPRAIVEVLPPIHLFGWGGPGSGALHEIIIPANVQLMGVPIYTQALFIEPSGRGVLTNALDGTIGV